MSNEEKFKEHLQAVLKLASIDRKLDKLNQSLDSLSNRLNQFNDKCDRKKE